MADLKLTQLAALSNPLVTDLVYVVSDPGGAPVSKKVTVSDLLNSAGYTGAVTLFATPASITAFGGATTVTLGAGAGATASLNFATAINLNTSAIVSNQATVALLNTTTTTVNAFGAATTITIGAATGVLTLANPSVRFADGSAAAPSVTFASDPDTGMFLAAANTLNFTTAGFARVLIDATTIRVFSTSGIFQIGSDVIMTRDAANTLALRNGVNAQTLNIYNTFTDASNYERVGLFFSSNFCYLRTESIGGTVRPMYIGTNGLAQVVLVTNNTERLFVSSTGNVVIGATSDNANAILGLVSTTKAFMPPRMTTTQKNAITSPASGMVVFDTTLGKLAVYGASAWETVTSA